jgi:hypothetical protein
MAQCITCGLRYEQMYASRLMVLNTDSGNRVGLCASVTRGERGCSARPKI